MSIPLDPRLDWEVIAQPELGFCRVTLAGVMTVDNAKIVLEDLWKHTLYLDQPAALWDVSQCDLPNFDALSEISAYIKKEKRERGPAVHAFVSPAFATSVLARAFRGFQRLVSLNLNFFGNEQSASDWLSGRQPGST
jgi:hypothetical protein